MDVNVLPSINKGSLLYFTLLYFTFTFTLLLLNFIFKTAWSFGARVEKTRLNLSSLVPAITASL